MKDQEQRKRNRIVGLILCLLFVGLFTFITLGFVIGLDVPPVIKTIVSVITTIIGTIIGILLIGAAFYDSIVQTVLDRLKKRGTGRISDDGTQ